MPTVFRLRSGPPGRAACLLLTLSFLLAPLPAGARSSPKNPKAAALLSILLPGLGEAYAGGPRSSRFFFFLEGSLWAGLALFEHLESARTGNFKAFAAARAGLDPAGKSDAFFDEVGAFRSLFARNRYEEFVSGEFADLRPETAENVWEWEGEEDRLRFRDLRKKATSARQKGLLFVGGLLFNRFLSAVNAAHIARKTRVAAALDFRVVADPSGGARALLRARF